MVSQVLLLSQPRTACHLLERILSGQPNVKYLWHPVVKARPPQAQCLSEESVAAGIPGDLRAKFVNEVQDGVNKWREALAEANEKKEILFVHEHPHFALSPDMALKYVQNASNPGEAIAKENYTLIPEDLLLVPGTVPIFTIRHPALVVPAAYRAMSQLEHSANRANLLVATRSGWQRDLYDWYVEKGISPIVIDADDFIADPDLIRRLCDGVGLDSDSLIFKWPKVPEEDQAQMMPMYVKLQQTLLNSDGIVPKKSMRKVDLTKEVEGWKQEFGEQDATFLQELLALSMPHYEYLSDRKIK